MRSSSWVSRCHIHTHIALIFQIEILKYKNFMFIPIGLFILKVSDLVMLKREYDRWFPANNVYLAEIFDMVLKWYIVYYTFINKEKLREMKVIYIVFLEHTFLSRRKFLKPMFLKSLKSSRNNNLNDIRCVR